jgi:DNA uptake protein ComE-like DNA-binding protein
VTAAAARDAKAVAQGVFDGLRTKGPRNINKATKQELETLPGIDPAAAQRIIAGRPYETSMELVRRHVISKATYGKIANRVVAH